MNFKSYRLCLFIFSWLKFAAASQPQNWRNFENSGSLDHFLPSREASDLGNFVASGNSSRTLSRKRRFIYPLVTPWLFDIRVTMDIPLQGLETAMRAYIPFTWNLNTLV
jgi:hypothetical protein